MITSCKDLMDGQSTKRQGHHWKKNSKKQNQAKKPILACETSVGSFFLVSRASMAQRLANGSHSSCLIQVTAGISHTAAGTSTKHQQTYGYKESEISAGDGNKDGRTDRRYGVVSIVCLSYRMLSIGSLHMTGNGTAKGNDVTLLSKFSSTHSNKSDQTTKSVGHHGFPPYQQYQQRQLT